MKPDCVNWWLAFGLMSLTSIAWACGGAPAGLTAQVLSTFTLLFQMKRN